MDSLNVLAQNMSVKLEQLKQPRAQFPKKHGLVPDWKCSTLIADLSAAVSS